MSQSGIPRSACFNGATAFRRWKAGATRFVRVPSRVRLQWGHRLSAMESWYRSYTLPSWKKLQWGHRLSAMESSGNVRLVATAELASMGPPPFGDGKDHAIASTTLTPIPLQWGHRLSAMERPSAPRAKASVLAASMGPPPFGDGKVGTQRGLQLTSPASMGPPPFGDGKERKIAAAVQPALASMGPPPFGDGKLPGWVTSWTLSAALQWGHRLSAMESRLCCPRLVPLSIASWN